DDINRDAAVFEILPKLHGSGLGWRVPLKLPEDSLAVLSELNLPRVLYESPPSVIRSPEEQAGILQQPALLEPESIGEMAFPCERPGPSLLRHRGYSRHRRFIRSGGVH